MLFFSYTHFISETSHHLVKSGQLYFVLCTIQAVSKQLHRDKQENTDSMMLRNDVPILCCKTALKKTIVNSHYSVITGSSRAYI